MERKAKGAMASLSKLSVSPFKGTPKDWIRFYNQVMYQIDSQPVSKAAMLGYLPHCVNG